MTKYIHDDWLNRIGSPYSPALIEALNRQNPAQRKVTLLDGGLAVVSGTAGSGKTGTLVNLLARCVSDGQDPSRILAMTFTRNAATEMNERLQLLGVKGARVGTIHSVCKQILHDGTSVLNNVALDDKDSMSMELKKLLNDMKRSGALPRSKFNKDAVIKFITACKSRGCAHVHDNPFGLNVALSGGLYNEADKWAGKAGLFSDKLVRIYLALETRRSEKGIYCFDDMLLWAWMALVASENLRLTLRSKYDLIIVDEAQDSNPVQWDVACFAAGLESSILRAKTGRRKNAAKDNAVTHYIELDAGLLPQSAGLGLVNSLYLFGDCAQSVYKFRAAEPALLQKFSERPGVDTIPMPYNYRSTPGICALGSALIRDKPWNMAGEMIPAGPLASTDLVETFPRVEGYAYPEEEAAAAVRWVQECMTKSADGLSGCAVLSRTAVALHLVEIECIRNRVPYRKMAAGSFFSSKEVRDILAYLRIACGMDNTHKWTRRIINTPFRYIGRGFIDAAMTVSLQTGLPLLDALLNSCDELRPQQARALDKLGDLLQQLNEIAVASENIWQSLKAGCVTTEAELKFSMAMHSSGPVAMIDLMLERTKYIDSLKSEDGLGEDDAKLACIAELRRMASLFKSSIEFLTYVDQLDEAVVSSSKRGGLRRRDGSKDPCLTLSTIHRSKGLEWDYVRIVDLTEGRFPHVSAPDLDEELRLLYVAITRAKRQCILSHPCGRDSDKKESTENTGSESSYCLILKQESKKVTAT